VLLGSSTAPIAYAFFVIFWLVSLALLAEAIRGLLVSQKAELKLESICICAAVILLLLQGMLGARGGAWVAALGFFVSAFVLVFIYARRLRRGRLIHP
jgi:O-antigen/teichoic acid export membrane protein